MSEEEKKPTARLKFVLTVEGDTAGEQPATIHAEAFRLDADGAVVEQAPDKDKTSETVITALYDTGVFLQTLSFNMGLKVALATGNIDTAIQLVAAAEELGLHIDAFGAAEADVEVGEKSAESAKSIVEKALKVNAA